jgi:hypothetical protein
VRPRRENSGCTRWEPEDLAKVREAEDLAEDTDTEASRLA